MAIDQIGFCRAGVTVLLRVITVGLQDVQIEEVGTRVIAADMAQLIDFLLDLAPHAGFGEVGTIAKPDKGIAPVLGACAGRGQAHCASSQ
ncbi:hypothetical protein D9M71_467290 [compost metagenome]